MSSPSFADLGVPARLAASLDARGIAAPFPIQAATLPDALAGRDVSGRAPTGSGKTIAFGIPLVVRSTRAKPKRPTGLVLVPTRELASQVAEELAKLAGGRSPSVAAFFGGVGYGNQLNALRRGVDIVVACPGRLADLIQQGHMRLDDVATVVVDEADRMADMGFLPEVRRLLDRVRPDRQTLLFSATLDGEVDVLVKRYQRDPAVHSVVSDADAPANRHIFWQVDRAERPGITADVVKAEWPAVVFCRTKRGADRLALQLSKEGVAAAAIHGDRSQAQRERALAAFAKGKVQALVATDVAARGIHVDDVAAVVHYDLPATTKDYLHRSGRTGRAGSAGLVVSLIAREAKADGKTLQHQLGYQPTSHAPDLTALTNTHQDARPATASTPSTAATVQPRKPGSAGPPRRRRRR